MQNNVLYGYNLNGNIEYRVSTGILININDGRIKKLANTNKRLLNYIIVNSCYGFVSDNDIAEIIFEREGLKYSQSRLRGAIRILKDVFDDLGSDSNFIRRNDRRGYYIQFSKVHVLISLENSRGLLNDFNIYLQSNGC
ncbi:hypothetical protein [Enterobacter hormaechei]|uniref:hypothetical protein n=1 Tax=Enterobacter hormaechei TaxID=158836 RepID=UPI0026E39099|nr:hypothetical protein [Enterobacter hormaechei]MDO6168692.1 hypothetical protein [Enterobacter hormaechei]MDO6172969.1 hypothetical protein [Enterobacter hormaechei]